MRNKLKFNIFQAIKNKSYMFYQTYKNAPIAIPLFTLLSSFIIYILFMNAIFKCLLNVKLLIATCFKKLMIYANLY